MVVNCVPKVAFDYHIWVGVNYRTLTLSKVVKLCFYIVLGCIAQEPLNSKIVINVEHIAKEGACALLYIAEGVGVNWNAHFVVAIHCNVGFLVAWWTGRINLVNAKGVLYILNSK